MNVAGKILHSMVLQMDRTPICILEGAATEWRPYFCWLPTRLFDVFDGFGQWVWLRTIERRSCKTADWLHPGPAYWYEYRLTPPPEPGT